MNLRAFALVVFVVAAARAAELPKGRLLEKVACASDAAQTYALYVPTGFDPAKKWPVLFCFDPRARGRVPVERFQAAAEKFGYIVAGSNNSRNGPWEANAAAINAMVGDVERFFPLESKRIYVAGLSGGARVACQIALTGFAQGVIACSAGFPNSQAPARMKFAFFGTAGVTDFNYLELRRVDRELDEAKAAHRVVIFDGGHEWLPAELTFEALAWLDLQAMRTGALAKDAAWIEAQRAERFARVPAAPAGERWLALKSFAADFKGLIDTAAWEKEGAQLAASREVRDWQKAERAAERKEQSLGENLLDALGEGFVGAAKKSADELRAKAAAAADTPERRMAVRVLAGAQAGIGESAREAMRTEDYERAASLLEMSVALRPDRGQTWFELARARAYLREKTKAIAALEQAVANGFKDTAAVENEKAFAPWRSDPGFAAVVAKMSLK